MAHKNVGTLPNQTFDDSARERPLQTAFGRKQSRYMLQRMIQVRKLIAVELTFLGPKFIIAEYTIAVVVGLIVGILSLRSGVFLSHALWQTLLGVYLMFLALTYAVLLAFAIAMAKRGDCRDEIIDELEDKTATFRKYRWQSLWLLLPLAVPIAAIRQR